MVLTWLVSTPSASRPAIELPRVRTRSAKGFSSTWEKEFLAPSMARSTADAINLVCCLDHNGKLDDSPQEKKQKAATTLLRDEFFRQDFAGPISSRASKVLGPISRFEL